MTPEQIDLARRAVASKHWLWMPGMAYCHAGYRYRYTEHTGHLGTDCYPDLTDPATLGCLLHLVREAWGERSICAGVVRDGRAYLRGAPTHEVFRQFHDSEGAALVAALDAAP